MDPTLEQDLPEEYTYNLDYDNTLDNVPLESQCPLSKQYLPHPLQHSIGQLDKLPSELITQVLLALDIPSLIAFQRVNRRVMSLVHQLYEYRIMLEHCPNVLRAIVSIGANDFDCRALFKTLSTSRCTNCHWFGPYLYLVTCKRVCYVCFTHNELYCPVTAAIAADLTGLSNEEIAPLPHIRSLPGRYTERERPQEALVLFDWRAVVDQASDLSGQTSSKNIEQNDCGRDEPRRFMAIISAPYFSSSGQSPDWGAQCTGCRHQRYLSCDNFWRHKFTKPEILEHVQQYGPIIVANQYARHEKNG